MRVISFSIEWHMILFGLTDPTLGWMPCVTNEWLGPRYLAPHVGNLRAAMHHRNRGMPSTGASELAYSGNETCDEGNSAGMRKADALLLRARLRLDPEKRLQIKKRGIANAAPRRKPLDQSKMEGVSMSRRPARFSQSDVARAIRAAKAAGASSVRVKPDGTIIVDLVKYKEEQDVDAAVEPEEHFVL